MSRKPGRKSVLIFGGATFDVYGFSICTAFSGKTAKVWKTAP